MASSYPGGYDVFTNPTPTTPLNEAGDLAHDVQHASVNDAVEAIQAELGLDPAGAAATVAARLSALESSVGAVGLTKVSVQSFSAESSVDVNAVFGSTFDHYKVIIVLTAVSGTDVNVWMRMRNGGSTDTGSNYAWQIVNGYGGGNTQSDGASSATAMKVGFVSTGWATFSTGSLDVLSPHLAVPTVITGTRTALTSGGNYYASTVAGWHKTGSAQDSFTIYPDSGTMTGVVSVFGYAK